MTIPHTPIVLRNLTPNDDTYDGKTNMMPDRKGGFMVNHPLLQRWIPGIQSAVVAQEIVKAFDEIAEHAVEKGKTKCIRSMSRNSKTHRGMKKG